MTDLALELVDEGITLNLTEDVIEIELANEQGPAGAPGGVLVTVSGLAPSTPTVVDSFSTAVTGSVKWLVTAIDTVTSDVGFKEVTVKLDASFTVSHAMRDVAFDVDVSLNVGDLELTVTNNGSNPIDLRITRIAII